MGRRSRRRARDPCRGLVQGCGVLYKPSFPRGQVAVRAHRARDARLSTLYIKMRILLILTAILIILNASAIAAEQAEVCIDRPENQGVLNIRPVEISSNGKDLFSIIGGEKKCVMVSPGQYELVAQSADPYRTEKKSVRWISAPLIILVQSNARIEIDLKAITKGATNTGPWKLTEKSTSRQSDEVNIERVNELVNTPIKQLGESTHSVQAILGTPSTSVVDQLANRHNPKQKDQIYTLTYKSLVVRIYDATSIKKEMLLSVRMTENQPGVLPELIGKTEKFIKDQFGEPQSKDINTFKYIPVYNIDEPGEDVVKIEFKNSLVSAVEWDYYTD